MTMTFYIFTNGDVADATYVNNNYNVSLKLECERAIANGAVELDTGSQKIIDIFTSAAGANTTVDTASSDTLYDSTNDYYTCGMDLSTIVLEPSFETITNWAYTSSGTEYSGGGTRVDTWSTQGTYSYQILKGTGASATGEYGRVSQTVDFTNINHIVFDYTYTNQDTDNHFKAKIGSTVMLDINATASGYVIYDCTAITGSQTLTFELINNNDVYNSCYVRIDNIRTNYADTTLQSNLFLNGDILEIDSALYHPTGTSYTTATTKSVSSKYVPGVKVKLGNNGSGNYSNYCKLTFTYSDTSTDTVEESVLGPSTSEVKTLINPQNKLVTSILFEVKVSGGTASDFYMTDIRIYEAKTSPLVFVTPYLAEELCNDAITFDYSMDNESNWETGNAINTWIDASGATNTGTLSIRLQLDTDDGSTTPKVKGWAVITE